MIMKLFSLVVGSLQENCYILVNEKNEALVIDPGDEAEKIISFLQPYKVVGILVTHFHFDHVGALKQLENYYNLKANQQVKEFNYVVLKTPGHTMDSISFYFSNEKIMFVGDFIFLRGIGRTDLGGDNELMLASIKKTLEEIPDDTILYPGHGDWTTLKNEKDYLEEIIKKEKL